MKKAKTLLFFLMIGVGIACTSPNHLHTFRLIIDAYQHCTPIPAVDEWKNYSNNQLWLRLVGQVMVAGGSRSKAKFDSRQDLQKRMNFDALQSICESKRANIIHTTLRISGVRFVGDDIAKSSKTKALASNFTFLSTYHNQFKGLMKDLSAMPGPEAEIERVKYLMNNLKYMKSKSARDFLMGSGMNRRTLAIDVRLRNIFALFNVELPSAQQLSNSAIYDWAEQELILKVCNPLSIEPMVMDRILYNNYTSIIKRQYLQNSLFHK